VSESEHALAFVISYEPIQKFAGPVQKPGGPGKVVYVYRHVNDETRLDYREMPHSNPTLTSPSLPPNMPSQWPRPPNQSVRRFRITASSAGSAAGGWVLCMRRKTSSSVATSP
jgi:hypothetical protein